MKYWLCGILLFLQCIAYAQVPKATPEAVGMSTQRLAYADLVIEQAVEQGQIPGAVLAVVRHGKLAYLKAYGDRQVYPVRKPMTVGTVFDMASCTKPMATAMSVMLLAERGSLRTNDAVKLYIPNFKSWHGASGDSTTIRLVDLLTHTSGLPAYAPVNELRRRFAVPNPQALMDYIATCRRDFAPKTEMQYSCLNYITLQHIVERITGQSLRDFAATEFFEPLGMAHTDFLPCAPNKKGQWVSTDKPRWIKNGEAPDEHPIAPTERQPDGSVLQGQVHDPLARVLNGGLSGNAGLFSTAEDVATLCAFLQQGGVWQGRRLLSPLTVKAMRTVPGAVARFGRSLGWDVHSAYASNAGDLLSPDTYGHTGYTGTSIVIDPVNDVSIILLTNVVHPVDKNNVVRLRALVANAVAGSIVE